ncbi:MAG: hypothetical protein IPN94_16735 [Sphingobacteriales bacterium]|nr:hypothetical protein [Sphingobacteriales bacterium]
MSTNDNQTPGSTYGNPPVNPSNPSGCAPIVASNGTYSFVCDTPGEYTFLVLYANQVHRLFAPMYH